MRSLRDSALANDWRLVFVGSITVGASLPVRFWQSALFPARVAIALIKYPRAMMHVHLAQRGSFWRKRIAAGLARLAGRPVLVHVHGSVFDKWASAEPRRLRAVARLLESSRFVVVLSESWRVRILALAGAAHCVVIRNSVALPAEPARGSDPPLVLFLGELGVRKGVDGLLSAIRGIQAQGIPASWVLAGEGDVAETRRKVDLLPNPDLVDVPGFLRASDKAGLLGKADVFVLPSFDEGLPVALLEAMAYGLACVVSPVGGIPEVVMDGKNGVFCTPGDATSIETALRSVLEDAEFMRRLGRDARRTVAECCSMDSIVEQSSTLYRQMSGG
jgi:glycosyltransferase involved in cell wall biosynthesis